MGPPLGSGGIIAEPSQRAPGMHASMGPPLGSGGIDDFQHIFCEGKYLLQWGHRLVAVESFTASVKFQFSPRLQWGHRLVAVESTGSAVCAPPTSRGFNGATAW